MPNSASTPTCIYKLPLKCIVRLFIDKIVQTLAKEINDMQIALAADRSFRALPAPRSADFGDFIIPLQNHSVR
jgi:hypothetical protein